jgi:hypothetical protein
LPEPETPINTRIMVVHLHHQQSANGVPVSLVCR